MNSGSIVYIYILDFSSAMNELFLNQELFSFRIERFSARLKRWNGRRRTVRENSKLRTLSFVTSRTVWGVNSTWSWRNSRTLWALSRRSNSRSRLTANCSKAKREGEERTVVGINVDFTSLIKSMKYVICVWNFSAWVVVFGTLFSSLISLLLLLLSNA